MDVEFGVMSAHESIPSVDSALLFAPAGDKYISTVLLTPRERFINRRALGSDI